MEKVLAFAGAFIGACLLIIRALYSKVKRQQTKMDEQLDVITQTKATADKAKETLEKRSAIDESYKKELTEEKGEELSPSIASLASDFYLRLQDNEGGDGD